MITIRRAFALAAVAIGASVASLAMPTTHPKVVVDVRSTAVSTLRTTPTPTPTAPHGIPRAFLVLTENGVRWDPRFAEPFVLCATGLSSSPSSARPIERAIPIEAWRVSPPIAYTRGNPCPDGRDRGER